MTIWKSDGDRKLLTLFAKMGIPLDQCKQTFTSMRKEFKDVLHAKIFQYAGNKQTREQLNYAYLGCYQYLMLTNWIGLLI